ncbi:hypothetical protein Bbelb_035560 [Branchiostoma belcheri]|nr:hypothetical protein Bbelb_035560 [Branchiostoma belcheri]
MPTELWDPGLSSNDWPQIQDMDFWKKAAEYVVTEADTPFIRSARSIRSKVVKQLRSEFPKGGGDAAEKAFGITCVGQNRQGTDEPLMPLNRMPFGLVQYQIEFFTCTNVQQITMPEDFRLWQGIMDVEFGQRFNRLFRGPAWSGLPADQCKDPMLARMNVAALSRQTVTKDIAKSGVLPHQITYWSHTSQKKHYVRKVTVRAQETFARVDFAINTLKGPAGLDDNQIHLFKDIETIDKVWESQQKHIECIQDPPDMPMYSIKKYATKNGQKLPYYTTVRGSNSLEGFHNDPNPKGRFWIKVDGTDIKPALQESMKGEWNGDPDLQDSRLQQLRLENENRVKLNNIIEKERERRSLQDRIKESISHFESDSQFLKERDYLITVDYYSNFFEIDMCGNTRDTTEIRWGRKSKRLPKKLSAWKQSRKELTNQWDDKAIDEQTISMTPPTEEGKRAPPCDGEEEQAKSMEDGTQAKTPVNGVETPVNGVETPVNGVKQLEDRTLNIQQTGPLIGKEA